MNRIFPNRNSRSKRSRLQGLWALPLLAVLLPGCTRDGKFAPVDMWNRSRYKPFEPVAFFDDNNSSRTPAQNTIARGHLRTDDRMYSGIVNGNYTNEFPMKVTKEMVGRGQERFNIYCMPCHGVAGHGDGMIVKRGFSPPPDYRIDRLRKAPVGHFYEVMTNGYGAMYSYAARVTPQDRWAIASYIRALQNIDKRVVKDVRYSQPINSSETARAASPDGLNGPGNGPASALGHLRGDSTTASGPNEMNSTSQVEAGNPGAASPVEAPAPKAASPGAR